MYGLSVCVIQVCVWLKCVCVWSKCVWSSVCGGGGASVCVGQVCVWAKYVIGPSEIRINQNLGFPHIFLISEVNS